MAEKTTVRDNLMTRPGYSPYCGNMACHLSMPRTLWDGEQFRCRCGWQSAFDAEFIARYKLKLAEFGKMDRQDG